MGSSNSIPTRKIAPQEDALTKIIILVKIKFDSLF
jgi:hypothetical protein